MNRLDFHSVATLLQKHLIESADMTQIVFISTIFSCFVNETDFSFDEGLCCKWMKGQARISPKIVSFYQLPQNKEEMYGDIEEELFLQISDIGALGEDLHNLLIADTSVSELQRNKLLDFYDSSDIGKIAIFVSELLIFAIGRPFIKANLKTASTSPSIEDIIITTTLPKPVRTYVEVTGTLEAIREALTNENILFIRGINEVNELEEMGLLTSRNQLLTIHPYVRKLINAKQLLCLSQADNFYKKIISCLSDETGNHAHFALSVMKTTLRFVKKDVRPLWKTLITHTLEASKRLHQYRLFQDMLSEYEARCHLYDNITNDDRALLFHYKATEYAFIYQNYNKAAQFEERAIAEACGTGTSKIFNLSSFYVDAGNYYAKLGNTAKALANLQKGAGILTTTKTHFTQYGIYVLSTYAKFLYECNKPAEAIPILIRCVNIYENLYEADTLTKGYLYQNLAAMLASINNRQKALLYYSQAETILKKYFDSEHPDIQICQEQEQTILSQKPSKPILLDNGEIV